jgi:putative ABC transport system permease protein
MGLGVALVVAVVVIHGVIDRSFRRGSQGYDMIVGAKGSPLQLVLNTVFHLSQPIENIPYSFYLELDEGDLAPAVETAIPVCMGHDYKGCRVVATVPEMFDKLTYLDDRKYEFAEGRNFELDNYFEAVAGSTAARTIGLKVGDTFQPVHPGQVEDEDHKDHENPHQPIKIVGILEHTGTPNDGAIFMNMEGFFRFPCHTRGPSDAKQFLASSGHRDDSAAHEKDHAAEHHDHKPVPDDRKEVTAVLICTDMSRPALAMALPDVINEGQVAQAVMPSRVIAELFDGIIGNVQLVLLVLAVLVVVVAGVGILVSIYNSMSDRRHDIAVMRALGASRMIVGSVILLESIILSLGGGAIGLLLGHGLIGLLGPTIAQQTGVAVSALDFQLIELILVPGLLVLASLVGYLPALSAYRTDVAKSLNVF